MRLKFAFPLVAALVGLGSLGGNARASHCGACAYPPACCCQEQCCLPTIRYRVCYQTVWEPQTRTCYRPVYQTVMRECCYTVCRPVFEQHVRVLGCLNSRLR